MTATPAQALHGTTAALTVFRTGTAAPAATPAPAAAPTLAARLNDGETFALSFAGQGAPWLETLRTCLLAGTSARLLTALTEAEAMLAPVADRLAGQRPDGFDPITWAEGIATGAAEDATADDGDPVPDDLVGPAVSVPGILATQIAMIDLLGAQGIDATAAAMAIGHSQGTLAIDVAAHPERAAEALAVAQILGVTVARHARRTGLAAVPGASAAAEAADAAWPMLSVIGATADEVRPHLAGGAIIGLVNGHRRIVVSGTPTDLAATAAGLADAAEADARARADKTRGGRPFAPVTEPLPIAAGFHNHLLAGAVDECAELAAACGIDEGWARKLAAGVVTEPVDWPADVARAAASADWILDLGPGEGIASLTRDLLAGTGTGVITAASDAGQAELFEPGSAPALPEPWTVHAPDVVKHGDTVRLETSFTRATGRSPILLGGMTPTTVDPAIVAAAANAGFWAELAGGGQVTPEIFRANVARLGELLDDGASAQFNTMFLDPYLWGMHIGSRRLVQRAVADGAPIDGVTISAGVPEKDDALALIEELAAAGIPHVSFKPGTVTQIRQVLAIADGTDATVIMQVEGGRAGGHHSWEDLDDLLLDTYADIRTHGNVVLAVGGGIGKPEQAADYLSGDWATAHGRPAMPVDAIIIGTAAMAAAESTASAGVKRMLVDTAGTADWVPAGSAANGMASGRSQLGADIHEIDNAAARAGRLLDEVAGDAGAVAARRDEIIAAINATAKPYFGDVAEMTYRELLERYVELAAPAGEFLDPSWVTRFGDLLDRAEARLNPADEGEFDSVRTGSPTPDDIEVLAGAYDLGVTLHPADVAHFLTVCRAPGKPVGFVPVIDADVRRWWRSDSLWQAHSDLYDADGVCIIPGTAAVAGITRADEPVAEILARFEDAAIDRARAHGAGLADAPADAAALVAAAPTVTWAGRQVHNPVARLGESGRWSLTADGGTGTVRLTVPLRGVGAPEETPAALRLDITAPAAPGRAPVITTDAAVAAMTELTRIAAGGTLPEPGGDGIVEWSSTWTDGAAADHCTVTGGTTTAPDAFVGHAWPAIFAAVAHATAADGTPAVEGMLSLVHLEHHIRLGSATGALPADGTVLTIRARVDEVADTDLGRVIVVRATITDAADPDGEPLATLTERFAIRGRGGEETARLGTVPHPTVTDTPRSFRSRRTITAPRSMVAFATVTGDRNPIHVDDDAARLAGLPGPIVHGMWLSAVIEHAAADAPAGLGGAVAECTTTMLAPVLPGQEVTLTVERRGIDSRPGLGEVREVTATVDGDPVATATAVIAAPRTFYAFPGQGIQAKGMGLAARAESPAARRAWADADAYTRRHLGFSVLAIVRDNPTEITVGGTRFHHPKGVLNLTQFTQVAMATLGLAQTAQLREAGVLDEDAFFAGHSVGEYNALAAFAGAVDAGAVLEMVYHRGLTMHGLVPRDAEGRSNYGLSALKPHKAGIAEDDVVAFVDAVAERSGEFLQVVNLNLAGQQYAVAGTLAGLDALTAEVGDGAIVAIPGIDVPFHSKVLAPGVDEFRRHLDRLLPETVDPAPLIGRYIPNLVARVFELNEDFVRSIDDVVDSPIIDGILADFAAAAADPGRLARTLLMELMAWQFCSPVRWIETQDLVLDGCGVDRVIEIGVGSAPTIANLAARSLRLPRHRDRDVTVLNVERDAAAVYARDEDRAPEVERDDAPAANSLPEAPEKTSPASDATPDTAPAPAPAAAPAGSGERPADITVTPADATEVLIALWTKVRPDQMGAADSIETLVDGVSSRRNQLLLDLGTEFGLGAIDGAADAELADLAETVTGLARGWKPWGPVLGESIADGLRRVTGPAGAKASAVVDRVTGTWRLGDGWAAAVAAEVVLGTREGASLRGGDLGHLAASAPTSAAELDTIIDAAVANVAAAHGVTVALPATDGSGSGVVDSAALGAFAEQVTGSTGVLAVAARTILEQLGHTFTGAFDFDADDADDRLLELVTAELGADWPRLVTPSFDADRAVLLDDRWATVREDLARMWTGGGAPATHAALAGAPAAQAAWWADRAEAAGREDLAAEYRRLAGDHTGEEAPGTFTGDVAVVTGASPDSIAADVVGGLLAGGATVVATTSSLSQARLDFYKSLYRAHATDGAALWVVPANLTSFQDLDALVEWVGTEQTATVGGGSVVVKPALRPTLLFPFAAPRVAGTLADAGPAAELQMRLLLWSVERLIAGLAELRADDDIDARVHVVLPGSPNRGRFGGDGAYGESKAALDALVNRWHAEDSWRARASIVHCLIGWVRGTGLMGGNDPLVDAVESRGVRTWSTDEMARELLDQADATVRSAAAVEPVTVDLTGGLGDVDLNMSALAVDAAAADAAATAGESADETTGADAAAAPHSIDALPNRLAPLPRTAPDFSGITVAPEDMVVIVGAAELGPWGSSRTRFEAETGELSAAGVVELAWSMGLIHWDNGWVDADGQDIGEADVVKRYRDEVLARTGVRRYGDDGDLVDNTMTELTTIYLDRDLSFPVRDRAEAATYVSTDPEHTSASVDPETGEWSVTRKAGTAVHVPRRMAMSRYVGGQIPEGFDPTVWGIPADMADNLDRVSLWNIVTTVDAFLSSGFSPEELLGHVHPGLVSSTQGTGIGAMESLRSLYIDGLLGQPRANDVLQEALPNVIAAHVMQSYVGGYGQMVHPVAACATAAVSVEEGMDKIRLGKADFVVAGGFDDLSTEGITGFGDMAATADSATLEAKGVDHRHFSRPNDRRRSGFVESAGGGTVLLARGSVAKDLGLPVLGVVAYASSFADGAHTSIPAPGLGALGAGRGGHESALARALAAHGVTADEVAVLSKHDTSTNANDPNESELHERLADALGRDAANPLFVVSQKSLTGHAKGGAAAFQLVGLTQVLRTGTVPANRSLDCVDPVLRKYGRLVWPTTPLHFGDALPLKAGFVTSLGFGHVSALVAIVHPEAFHAAVERADGPVTADAWRVRADEREAAGLRRIDDGIHGGEALFERPTARRLGDGAGYESVAALEKAAILDPATRLVDGVLTPAAADAGVGSGEQS